MTTSRILPFVRPQPNPIDTLVIYYRHPTGIVTSITRIWPEGTTASCRLCPRCTARLNVCAVQIGEFVPTELAPSLTVVDRPCQSRADDPRRVEGGAE